MAKSNLLIYAFSYLLIGSKNTKSILLAISLSIQYINDGKQNINIYKESIEKITFLITFL